MNLREVRIGLGISQTCLSRLLGCTQHRISELETGKGGRRPTKQHWAACRALEVLHDHNLLQELIFKEGAEK